MGNFSSETSRLLLTTDFLKHARHWRALSGARTSKTTLEIGHWPGCRCFDQGNTQRSWQPSVRWKTWLDCSGWFTSIIKVEVNDFQNTSGATDAACGDLTRLRTWPPCQLSSWIINWPRVYFRLGTHKRIEKQLALPVCPWHTGPKRFLMPNSNHLSRKLTMPYVRLRAKRLTKRRSLCTVHIDKHTHLAWNQQCQINAESSSTYPRKPICNYMYSLTSQMQPLPSEDKVWNPLPSERCDPFLSGPRAKTTCYLELNESSFEFGCLGSCKTSCGKLAKTAQRKKNQTEQKTRKQSEHGRCKHCSFFSQKILLDDCQDGTEEKSSDDRQTSRSFWVAFCH